ncbi:MAG TPA: FUSC family protein [Fimbriimonas sp.]|nr:FUSC family protein [Fimbriimonas sp.]
MPSRFQPLMRSVFFFDSTRWSAWTATRCSAGVALPVIIATALGRPSFGVLAGLGALYTGLASFNGVYRSRIRQVILTGLIVSVVTALGCLIGLSTPLVLIVVPLAGFIAALFGSSGQGANALATMGMCTFIVLSGLGLPASTAWANAGLILAGALVQLVLLTAVWPVNPRLPERQTVAAAFRTLSRYAHEVGTHTAEPIPGTSEIENARAILNEARNTRWRAEHEVLVTALRAAEAVRATLVGFEKARQDLQAGGEEADKLAEAIGAGLQNVAERIVAGKMSEPANVEETLPDPPGSLSQATDYLHWYRLLRRLLTELDQPFVLNPPVAALKDEPRATGWRRAFSKLTRLPNVPVFQAVAVRHAVRYAVTMEIAEAIYRLGHLPHGYWLPLTVTIVLRSDYANTVSRGLSRLSGTLAGVLVADLFVMLVHPSNALDSILSVAATWLVYAFFQPNYASYSIAITLYVVFSVSASGLATNEVGLVRLGATVFGTILSLLAYVFWPAFHGKQIREAVVEALKAQIEFGELLERGVAPRSEEAEECRNHARSLRVQAENLFQSASLEPWGLKDEELAAIEDSILCLDENAADLLALMAHGNPDLVEFDRVLQSSRDLAAQLTPA